MTKSVSHPISTLNQYQDIGVSGWYGVWYRFCHVLFLYLSNVSMGYVAYLEMCNILINEKLLKFWPHWKSGFVYFNQRQFVTQIYPTRNNQNLSD